MQLNGPILAPIINNAFVGPPAVRRRGARKSLGENETPTLESTVFCEKSASGRALLPANVEMRLGVLIRNVGLVIRMHRELIGQHVENRVAMFFEQYVVCVGTGLQFQGRGAQHQALTAPQMAMRGPGGALEVLPPRPRQQSNSQGAHSSTNPCLIVHHNNQDVVYMEGAFWYRRSNGVCCLPETINAVDSAIDRQFRLVAVNLLNRASQDNLTPEVALYDFLAELSAEIGRQQVGIPQEDLRQLGLHFYARKVARLLRSVQRGPTDLIDQLIELDTQAIAQPGLRTTVYRIRFRLIRESQLFESQLYQQAAAGIQAVQANFNRAPNYLEEVCRDLIISGAFRRDMDRLRTFYSVPGENYRLRKTARRRALYDATLNRLQPYHAQLRALGRQMSLDMRRQRTIEQQQRGVILRHVREAKAWSQANLGERLGQQFPGTPSSQATICRSERGMRTIDATLAQRLAAITQVDSGIFLTRFFYS